MTAERFARVLVPLGPAAHGRLALDTAIGVAAALGARIEGLFVEDARLARAANLPFAREVGSLTAMARALGRADVERAFRVEAAHLQQLLVVSAARARIESSFEVTRGEALAEIVARAADLTVLSGSARSASRRQAQRPRIAVLYDGSAGGHRALEAAGLELLPRANDRELLILVPHDTPAAHAADARAHEWLAALRLPGAVRVLPHTPDALLWALRMHHGTQLALPLGGTAAMAQDLAALAALAAAAPCALILVR